MEVLNLVGYENFEKIAFKKMEKMTVSKLMSLISLYIYMNMLNKENPLYNHLCNFTPFFSISENNNIYKDKNHCFGNQIFPSLSNAIKLVKLKQKNKIDEVKEKPINFNLQKNKYLQRYHNSIKRLIDLKKLKLVIKIQRFFRAYLQRITFIKTINSIIIDKFLKKIITIQKVYKSFYYKRKFRIDFIINFICEERRRKINLIKKAFISFYEKNEKKRQIIINEILNERKNKSKLIQSYYKMRKIKDKVSHIIKYEKENYILTYPYKANKVDFKILTEQNKIKFFQTFTFELCPIRNILILHINYSELKPGNYYCQFIVDGKLIVDKRFPYFETSDGQFFNLIEFTKGEIKINDNILEKNIIKNLNYNKVKINNKNIESNNNNGNYNKNNNYEYMFNQSNKKNYNNDLISNKKNSIKKNSDCNYNCYNITYNNNFNKKNDYSYDYYIQSNTYNTVNPNNENNKINSKFNNNNYYNVNYGYKSFIPFTNYTSDNSNNNSRKQSNEEDYITSLKKNLEGIVFEYSNVD